MPKVIDRSYDPISISDSSRTWGRLEIRIHGIDPRGDRVADLTAKEARLLAHGLLSEAKRLDAAARK
jgi:hypothetical protein